MTRPIRTTLVLSLLLGPAAALAQAADKPAEPAAQPGPADAARPLEPAQPVAAAPAPAPAPAPAALPSVLSKFSVTLYGYVNFDMLYDTTRTHSEGMGNGGVARPDTQAGEEGRWIFTARNSRFGFRIAAPEYQQLKASALLETDFGQMYSGASESTYYTNGLLRLRQAHFKIESPWVDVIFGQTTYLFGWQSSFFPATAAMLGIAGEPFGRTPQLRLTKLFKTRALNVEVAAGAFRPPQRDVEMPELQGGVRLLFNDYKGTHSLGAGGTAAYPMAFGVSGAVRQLRTSAIDPANPGPPATGYPAEFPEEKVNGYAVSFDALVPILPSRNGQRGNTLTLVGTFAITKAAGDLLGGTTGNSASAGVTQPGTRRVVLPDVGNVVLDDEAKPHAVNWNGAVVGMDYYLPPSGRVFVSGTFGVAYSDNITRYLEAGNRATVFYRLRHWDANVFFDLTSAARLVLSWQHRESRYADGVNAKSDRYHFSAYYFL